MTNSDYSLRGMVNASLVKSKTTQGFINKSTTYKSTHNVGSSFGENLVYSNSPTINKDFLNRPALKSAIELFASIGAKELVKVLDTFPFETKTKQSFEDYSRGLIFRYDQLLNLEESFLKDLENSGIFRGYGGLRTVVNLELIVEESSKFYNAKLKVSVHYQFFLVMDPFENVKIDLIKNKDIFPDFEKVLSKQTTFKINKE